MGLGGGSGKPVSVGGDVVSGTGGGATRKRKGSKRAPATADTKKGRSVAGAAFAQRIGVIFSAMYNTYIDGEILQTIRDVAGRLAASTASQREWSSSELGRYVHFADGRSQARVRDILALYSGGNLQTQRSSARVKREHAAFVQETSRRFGIESLMIQSRSLGVASLRQDECIGVYSSTRKQCKTIFCGPLTWISVLRKNVQEGL